VSERRRYRKGTVTGRSEMAFIKRRKVKSETRTKMRAGTQKKKKKTDVISNR